MEKRILYISLTFMSLSACLAISSVSTSSWIINSFSGVTTFGLSTMCVRFDHITHSEECQHVSLSGEWRATSSFIILGVFLTCSTILQMLLSIWKPIVERIFRITSFCAIFSLCVAAIIFPFGFHAKEIGGVAYRLPPKTSVGYSYFLFIGGILLLTAGNILFNFDVIRRNFRR